MKLNNLNLNMLKCFQAVAEKGSLQSGAKALSLTSSAVYQSIKKLEVEIDQHLFFRTGNRYILTEAGRSLQELFQKFMWELSQFNEGEKSSGAKLEGEIRVGLPLNFSKSVFIPLMKRFIAEYPKVQFQLTIAETQRLITQICAFEIDFAIIDDAVPSNLAAKTVRTELVKEELVLACSKSFFRTNDSEFQSVKRLKELPHLDYAKDFPLVQRWYKLHYKRQVQVNATHIIDNVESMVTALKEGIGLGVIPKTLLKDLYEVSTGDKILSNTIFMVQEANYINSPLMKRFIQFMQANA